MLAKRWRKMKRWLSKRWEAAETNRLNSAHWRDTGKTINTTLSEQLSKLRDRSRKEAEDNPIVEGVINTHVLDTVGWNGPTLQIQDVAKGFGDRAEEIWREWWSSPDINEQLSGTDILNLNIRLMWVAGEFFNQITKNGEGRLRLSNIHPRRIETPIIRVGNDQVFMGIRLTKTGRPLTFYVQNESIVSGSIVQAAQFAHIPAKSMIHGFQRREPDQIRGVPWLAPSLQSAADMRDYDAQVLDAARAAADFAAVLTSKHPDIDPVTVDASVEIERRMLTTAPPGWEVTALTPQQPSTQYVEYRGERLREIGRPVNMPLMMVMLDSSNHNFSSARFDGQIYQRGLRALQGWLERIMLNRLVRLVIADAQLREDLPAVDTSGLKFVWTWPVPPHVDPKKEADAERIRLENGTLTYADACAANGKDWESVIEQRQREAESLAAAGLPPLPVPKTADSDTPGADKDDKDDGDDDKPTNGNGVARGSDRWLNGTSRHAASVSVPRL